MRAWLENLNTKQDVIYHAVDREELEIVKDHAAALRGIGVTGTKDDKLAATMPGWVILDWCNKHGITWPQFWADKSLAEKMLADPDNAAFRVWEGKL